MLTLPIPCSLCRQDGQDRAHSLKRVLENNKMLRVTIDTR